MPITYADAIAKYGNVQGNILKGHGRDFAMLLFLAFKDESKAKAQEWIQSLLPEGKSPVNITSTKQQLEETLLFKKTGIKGAPFATLLLSATGLEFLTAKGITDPVFIRGMRTDLAVLKDPAKDTWNEAWWQHKEDEPIPDDAKPTTIHALLLLADDDEGELQRLTTHVVKTLPKFSIEIVLAEQGNVVRNENGDGIEHFGYADGVSQPVFLLEDMPNHPPRPLKPKNDSNSPPKLTGAKDNPLWEDVDQWDPGAVAEDLVLVPDALASKEFGSFFVFRKLEQDVRGFKEAEEELGKKLKLPQPDAERAGAMIVGRFEDGTPVTKRYTEGLNYPIVNNFNYNNDAGGLKCPFHAHIRKVNPRETTVFDPQTERRHQLTRRGIPYGKKEQAQSGRAKVGLLFMCYQKSIADQFEFVQKSWANEDNFPEPNTGPDVLIGPAEGRPAQPYTFVWGEANPPSPPAASNGRHAFEAFVHLRGGEYFYAPSLPGLEALASGAPLVAGLAGAAPLPTNS